VESMRKPVKLIQLMILIAATAFGMKLSVAVYKKPLVMGMIGGRGGQRFSLSPSGSCYFAEDVFEVSAPCLFCWTVALALLSIRRNGGPATVARPRPSVWCCWMIVILFIMFILYDGLRFLNWFNVSPSKTEWFLDCFEVFQIMPFYAVLISWITSGLHLGWRASLAAFWYLDDWRDVCCRIVCLLWIVMPVLGRASMWLWC
jgi:hypothetical protein